MSNLSTLTHKEQTTRKIIKLLEQLTKDYQEIQLQEISKIIRVFPANDREPSIPEEIDLKTTDLRGYASQIKIQNQIQNSQQALKNIQENYILDTPSLAEIYFMQTDQFPLIYQYLQKLDYLKFLIIDWLGSNDDSIAKQQEKTL